MEIEKVIEILTEIRKNSSNTNNKKYAEKFIRLLNEINLMDNIQLNKEILDTELKIVRQNFEIEKENINVKNELKTVVKFLKSAFSLTTPWYYTQIGAVIGLISTLFFGFLSLFLGLFIGAIIGYYLDEKSKKEGKKLKTDLSEFFC
jgi:ABC-type phosphate transport system permease subunit